MKVTVVAGNPKPGSRTLQAATTLATAICGAPPTATIDVVTLGPGLLGWGDPNVAGAVAEVAASDLAVFASPTFKATFTGVLKLFLDQFATGDGLAGVVAVSLMLGAGPAHALAPQVHLQPVLAEVGATCPAPALYLLDSAFTTDGKITGYAGRWGRTLRHAATAKAAA
ncbi:MAG TPA: NAD(P)H-dependent oxidoreductase [Trebonia sp.]|jgi:FMN reductase